MSDMHPIDAELLTMLGELPERERSEDDLAQEVVDYLFDMAAEPRPGSLEAIVLAAYLAGGETAALEQISLLPGIDDDRIKDALLRHASATVSARKLIEQVRG